MKKKHLKFLSIIILIITMCMITGCKNTTHIVDEKNDNINITFSEKSINGMKIQMQRMSTSSGDYSGRLTYYEVTATLDNYAEYISAREEIIWEIINPDNKLSSSIGDYFVINYLDDGDDYTWNDGLKIGLSILKYPIVDGIFPKLQLRARCSHNANINAIVDILFLPTIYGFDSLPIGLNIDKSIDHDILVKASESEYFYDSGCDYIYESYGLLSLEDFRTPGIYKDEVIPYFAFSSDFSDFNFDEHVYFNQGFSVNENTEQLHENRSDKEITISGGVFSSIFDLNEMSLEELAIEIFELDYIDLSEDGSEKILTEVGLNDYTQFVEDRYILFDYVIDFHFKYNNFSYSEAIVIGVPCELFDVYGAIENIDSQKYNLTLNTSSITF